MRSLTWRKPLFTIVPQYVLLPNFSIGEKVTSFCRSSLMHSVQSFELDDNCCLVRRHGDDELCFDQVTRLTHIRISLWHFDRCIHLLNQLGSQLHSFQVNIGQVCQSEPILSSKMRSVSKISQFGNSMNLFI